MLIRIRGGRGPRARTALVVLACCVGLARDVSAQGATPVDPQPEFSPHMLATSSFQKSPVRIEQTNGDVSGTGTYSFRRRKVLIRWRYKVNGYSVGVLPHDASLATTTQTFSVSFHPTEVACVAAGKLLVAGVDDAGSVLVEEWTFDPIATPDVTFTASGQQIAPRISAKESRRLVYKTPHAGHEYVGAIFRNWGNELRPFLVLVHSKTVVQLDLTDLSSESVAVAVTNGDSALVVPELSALDPREGYDRVGGGLLLQGGARYWLSSSYSGGRPTLVLTDNDLDGTLDGSHTLDYQGWRNSPLALAGSFEKRR